MINPYNNGMIVRKSAFKILLRAKGLDD